MEPIQKIAIAGAGKVASHLGKAILDNELELAGIWNHLPKRGKALAKKLGVNFLSSLNELDVDLIIIAVSDDAIEPVSMLIPDHIPTVHTSGNSSIGLLHQKKKGVLWPLQTFTEGQKVIMNEVPICIETNDSHLEWSLFELAKKWSQSVQVITHEQRRILHMAAVVSCNFSNALYALSSDMLAKHQLPFSLLHALIKETASKALRIPPLEAQTGPALRGDTGVLNTQLQLLEEYPQWQEIYSSLTELIISQQHGKKL